ncbi:unnamed protein product [Oncorhynchus mykiss]|uniref:Syntaxin-18 n=1 Tax=Oncorhynchus mykiss TaxID=8022 RepID=A0A060Y064_ONCMY|nr:unnamed protein product [Oncorhynchus mykiss]
MGVVFDLPKDEIFKKSRPNNGFSLKAKEVISNITKLKDFLLQHRKDYVNAGRKFVGRTEKARTNKEAYKPDSVTTALSGGMGQNSPNLLWEASEKRVISTQIKEHRGAVLDLIEMYLKGVCKLYSEQRAIRVKRVVDKKRLSRLEPEHHHSRTVVEKSPQVEQHSEEKTSKEESSSGERSVMEVPENTVSLWEEGQGRVDDELSPEEMQMFEQENQRLVSEMSNLVDEVRQIEGKVVEISRLQEIFAEKVLMQETEIDSIHQLVVGATENVKEGNEDIREAIQNNAGFRVWILFFLVMCSFSLLFLDWYDS